MCTCYDNVSKDLCQALAGVTKRLCTEYVDPECLAPFLASRLIALDKKPGVCPIGVGDTARRIIAKAILLTLKSDILDMTECLQLCAGQTAGCEAAIHAVQSTFETSDCEALLLVDAKNAFNSLNRQTALRNIKTLCPLFATPVINIYRHSTDLFVGGDVIKSAEGIPREIHWLCLYTLLQLAIPLIKKLTQDTTQIWYGDDAASMGKMNHVHK